MWQLDRSELPASSIGHNPGSPWLEGSWLRTPDAIRILFSVPEGGGGGDKLSIITQYGGRSVQSDGGTQVFLYRCDGSKIT